MTAAKVEDPEDEACIFSAARGSLWKINIGQPAPNLNLHPRVVIIFFNQLNDKLHFSKIIDVK